MATYETAQDQFVTVGDITFAYRRLGRAQGIPLVLLMHFRGTMDHWDPALINPLAKSRPVLLIDNAGVGRSGGQVPKTFPEWAKHYIDVISELGVRQVDVMGFSMGGCVAQLVALNAPRGMVRRVVLCGTTPSTGEGVVTAPLGPFNQLKAAVTDQEQKAAFLSSMFVDSERSQAAGVAAWHRITTARQNRVDHVPAEAAHRQAIAFAKFMDRKQANEGSYDRFHQLRLPVLIANGEMPRAVPKQSGAWSVPVTLADTWKGAHDLLLPTDNSILMWKMLRDADAQLHLYPDSGHGFLYQYADHFAGLINNFLDQPAERISRL